MLRHKFIAVLSGPLLLAGNLFPIAGAPAAGLINSDSGGTRLLAWPALTREQRPWAYWWWMGSAVDQTNLTRELTRYREAGYGGVHIIPIYGAKGWESNYISYLSPRWMEMLDHTVREANRLDLGVDMTTGTGWCFGGGPYVGEQEGNASVVVKTFDLAAGAKLTEKFDPKKTQALVAFENPKSEIRNPKSDPIDLTREILADGSVSWAAPAGGAKVYAVSQRLNAQKVKRAAPGGEGPMLNLIYPDAMPVFLRSHTEAFAKYRGAKPRAQYHDSYEYKSEWSPDFFNQFEKRRGYKLQSELPALFASGRSRREEADSGNTNRLLPSVATERSARVLADYRETVSDVMIEDSLPQWVKWSKQRGFMTRNEAHGSPGNLLDLYALVDVPETEMFRLDRNKLISKFASSAAHVAGRKLVGCETGTWLKEHFTETLADMKYLLDDLFVSGVNHVFYHGTCYSPDEAGWPGWVFYASYEMNPRNSVWRDARALNDYVARCQAILQSGKPDNDILLYWPIHDFWQKGSAEPLLPHLTVHAQGWFESQPLGKLAEQLWRRGFAFDYVSDRQLAAGKISGHDIKMSGGDRYRAIVIPPCDFLPLATMEKLVALAKAGATVIFAGQLPKEVPGLGELEARHAKFTDLLAQAGGAPAAGTARSQNHWEQEAGSAMETQLGKGRILIGDLERALAQAGVAREALVDHEGLFYIRRSFAGGRHYFLANRSEQAIEGWIPLATKAQAVVLLDALSGRTGIGAMRAAAAGVEVYVQLQPGESVIARTLKQATPGAAWDYWQPAPDSELLVGQWKLQFLSGGPELPPALSAFQPGSWTGLGGEEAKRFAGTARYSLKFDAPYAGQKPWRFNLGKVCQSARVRLNGKDYGTLLAPPFRVVVDNLKPAANELEVEVTNVAANRIRDLDRRGVKWQNFHDINFVNQDYKPFNAANWPLTDSGLLGPVTLTPVAKFLPRAEVPQ